MKLYYDKKSKNPTYYIQHGFRNGKKTSTRNVAIIGIAAQRYKIEEDFRILKTNFSGRPVHHRLQIMYRFKQHF